MLMRMRTSEGYTVPRMVRERLPNDFECSRLDRIVLFFFADSLDRVNNVADYSRLSARGIERAPLSETLTEDVHKTWDLSFG